MENMENTHDASLLLSNSDYPMVGKYTDPIGHSDVTLTFISRDVHATWLNMYRAKHGADPVLTEVIEEPIEVIEPIVEPEEELVGMPEEAFAVTEEEAVETFDGTFAPEELFAEEA